jgi:hypothetical protein
VGAGCSFNDSASLNRTNPALFYYSKVWSYTFGMGQLKLITEAITARLPHVGTSSDSHAAV